MKQLAPNRKFVSAIAVIVALTITPTRPALAQLTPRPHGIPPSPGGPPPDISAQQENLAIQLQALRRGLLTSSRQLDELKKLLGPKFSLSPHPHNVPLMNNGIGEPPFHPKIVSKVKVDGVIFDCVPKLDQIPASSRQKLVAPDKVTAPNLMDTPPGAHSASTNPKPHASASLRCPENTVPIREQSMKSKEAPPVDFIYKYHGYTLMLYHSGQWAPHWYAHAVSDIANRGFKARLNVWAPRPGSAGQMTLSQTWIAAYRPNGKVQTIESGWQVWKGWRTQMAVPFIYFTTNNYSKNEGAAKDGCYDVSRLCHQFVLVTNRIILGRPIPASEPGGHQQGMEIEWFLKRNGNWWLKMDGVWIGYYPKKIFGTGPLSAGGQVIDLGGEATGSLPTSEIGSGRFAEDGYKHAAYAGVSGYYDMAGRFVRLPNVAVRFTPSGKAPACYSIRLKVHTPAPRSLGFSFFFGGPGTNEFGVDPYLPKPPPEKCRGVAAEIKRSATRGHAVERAWIHAKPNRP